MSTPAILDDIYAITMRPDRVTESKLGIRQALQMAHSSDEFPSDLIEVRMQADALDFEIQADLDLKVRKISHIVPQYLMSDGTFQRGDALNYVEPRAFHTANVQATGKDFYYIAGRKLNIKIRVPTVYFLLSYWQYPDLADDKIDDDWIVKNYPQVIVYGAVMLVYRALGNAADSVAYQQLYSAALQEMTRDILYLGDVADSNVLDTENDWGGQGGY